MQKFTTLILLSLAVNQVGEVLFKEPNISLLTAAASYDDLNSYDLKFKLDRNGMIQKLDKSQSLDGSFWLRKGGQEIYMLGATMLEVYETLTAHGVIEEYVHLFGHEVLNAEERDFLRKIYAV